MSAGSQPPPPRVITQRYDDPVDLIWLGAARALGLEVRRSSEVFASWDGEGVLTIGSPETLDPDDCLAQMILHELCHGLVEAPEGLRLPDWGLENADDRDLVREHASHRLQLALAAPHGLERLMAATTDWRPHWDQLPDDPLAPCEDPDEEAAAALARRGLEQAREMGWLAVIERALAATASIAEATGSWAAEDSLWAPRSGSTCRSR